MSLAGVKDRLNFVLGVRIIADELGWRRQRDHLGREERSYIRGKDRVVENIVYAALFPFKRNSNAICRSALAREDFEGSVTTHFEFLRRTLRGIVLGSNPNHVTGREGLEGRKTRVIGVFHAFFSRS